GDAARRERPRERRERRDKAVEVRRPRLGVEAEHGDLAVAVEDEPRDTIAFPVAEPVGGRLGVEAPVAPRDRGRGERGEPAAVEGRARRAIEDADRDRGACVPEPATEEAALI